MPRLVETLGYPPFIDGVCYTAIIRGLRGEAMAAADKPLSSALIWSGFEDTRAGRRSPIVGSIAAVWHRAGSL